MKITVINGAHKDSLEVKGERPILFELLDKGVHIPHGCLSGVCGACRIKVSPSKISISPIEKNTLEACEEKSDGSVRLSCRMKAEERDEIELI